MSNSETSARDAREAAHIQDIIEQNFKALPEGATPVPRAQHGKHHGCVVAEFKVREDLPDALAGGVFLQGKSYAALVRFSNGGSQDDTEADAHGMAIKLLNVPGAKLLPNGQTSQTHDFVLLDHPVFFSTDLEEYAVFNKTGGRLLDLANDPGSLEKTFGIARNVLKLLFEDVGLVWRLRKFKSQTPNSPLASNYWSNTPYRLGQGHVAKFVAETSEEPSQEPVKDADGLKRSLQERMEREPVVSFTFGAHVKTDPPEEMIEDSTKIWWPEADEGGLDAYVPLATITLNHMHPQSDWISEHMVFSPWNVLPAHEPLGVMNRLRKAVYAELARRRHVANGPEGFDPPGTTDIPANQSVTPRIF